MSPKTSGQAAETKIRPAKASDLKRLESIERATWGNLGTELYCESHFKEWLLIHPDGFWVAEKHGMPVGYVYGQLTNFNPSKLSELSHCNRLTDNGYTTTTHNPCGNSLYGVSVVSGSPGAGKLLIQQLYRFTEEKRHRYYFGFPRISGFSAYLKRLNADCGRDIIPTEEEAEVALWYVHESAAIDSIHVMPSLGPKPNLNLPMPKADPVLNWHLKHWNLAGRTLGIAKLIPGFMKDPESHNYGVLIYSENTTI